MSKFVLFSPETCQYYGLESTDVASPHVWVADYDLESAYEFDNRPPQMLIDRLDAWVFEVVTRRELVEMR